MKGGFLPLRNPPSSKNYGMSTNSCLTAYSLCLLLPVMFDVEFCRFLCMMGGVV